MRNFKLLLIAFICCSTLVETYAQNIEAEKDINVKEFLTEEKLNLEVKEFFVRELRETGLVKPIDNHEFIHFFIDRYDNTYKNLIVSHFQQFNIISELRAKQEVINVIAVIANDFNEYKVLHPTNPEDYNKNVNINHFDFFNLGSETYKGPGQPCNNADFETGNATGWDLTDGEVNANPYEYVNTTATGLNAQHVIQTGGNDPTIGAALPMVFPGGGGVSLQLGDGTGTGGLAAGASQTFLVDANSAAFTYSYALVMEDPSGHTTGEKPFFKVNMFDQNGDPIQCGDYQVISGPVGSGGDPDFVAYGSGPTGYYLPWRTTFAPLQAYIGQNVTIQFITGDCSQSGHYGYGYIDASCDPLEIIPDQTVICGGQPVTLTAPPGAASYAWTPNGETTQTITTNVPGHYEVTIIPVTGAACGLTLTADIGGSPDYPVASFDPSPTTVCLGTPIDFTNNSYVIGTSAIDSVQWDFNSDGTIDDTAMNPTYTYPSTGNFTATLIVWNNGCQDDTTMNVTITPGTNAIFSAPAVCVGTPTVFTDASTPAAVVGTWDWDFDADATIDNSTQNPTYTFPTAGTFPVQLSVADASGNCGNDTIINVVVHPKPVADFSVNDTCLTLANQFNDNSTVSTGTITGWDWDFDNNGTIDNSTQNPTNTYGASGTQTIELVVTTNNTCKDTITKTVEIFDNPVAAFVSDTACEPFVSTMTDETILGSIGISNWDWDFDANATIDNTLQNPTNTFGVAGSYPVTLNVTDSNGCTSSVTENVIIAPKPTAAFNFSDVCFGAATNFTDQSNGNGGTIDTWEWDFTNNGTVDNTLQNPSNGYPSANDYNVELVVTTIQGCKDTVVNLVDVDAIPVANFSAAAVCLGDVTMFYDSSVVANSNINQWSWDFESDATIDVNTQNPTFTYPAVGPFNATLTVVSDSGCINTVVIPVDVSPNPIANFTTDTACLTSATTFTDATTLGLVAIETWEWDFDNNTTIDDGNQNPTFTFAPAGTYIVGLNVIDSLGCSHDTLLNVTVSENPIAGFTFSDECFGTNTTFTNQSLDNGGTTPIDSWEWDFDGDGVIDDNTSNPNPTNLFDTAGVYQTMLVVTSTLGCNDTAYVNVDVDDIPVANFGGTNECLGNVTTFTDSSSVNIGNVNQWDWDFGDGVGTSALQNPTYTYTSAGIKNVTLIVYSDSGCTHTFNTNIEVYAHPIANFTPDTVCNSSASNFTDVSSLASFGIETWTWDFGDGTGVSNDQNPSYGYNGAGDYQVNLSVVDSFGCGHDTTKTVTVSENPIAAFTFSDECFGANTVFTNQSLDNGGTTPIDNWSWDFDGDGIEDDNTQAPSNMFDAAGVYTTQLIVTSTLGCKDTAYVNVDVDAIPVANFGLENVCLNYVGTFTDSSTVSIGNVDQWSWDFGDGVGTSVVSNPTYTYTNAGIYNVTLDVVSDSGCTHSVTLPVEVYPNPTANFDTTDVCLNVAAQFTDQSVGNGGTISGWAWDFENDGFVDDVSPSPSHNYPSDGTYDVELIVSTTSGCKDTLMKSVTIYPMPTADFTFVNSCFMDSVEFTDNSNVTSGTISQWQWDLSDGQSSGLQNPPVYYSNEGIYDVELIVTTNNNCKDTITKTGIEVWPLPVVNFGPTAVCINYATQFTDSSTVSNTYTTNNNVQWDWNFGNGVGSSMDQNPVYAYPVDGVYMATLTVTTNNNCVDSATKPVTVYPQPEVDFVADIPAACTPVEVNFTDLTVLNGGNMATSTWEWDVNSDGNTDLYGPNPMWQFTNPSHSSVREFDITLTVTSQFGCVDSLTKTNYISSYPIPLASFSFDPNDDATIVDNEIQFTDQSIISSTWQWDLGDGTQTTVTHPLHEYADTGYYWVTLNIENEYGCTDSTAKLVKINPIYAIWIPNAFTPNGDRTNDYFYVDGYGIKELQVQIYDRWGLKLYDGIGLDQSWDGTYKGKLVQLDVYVYKVRAKDVFDEWHDYIGKVTVVE
jgi:gliding motility-associated-like protein